MVINIIDIMIDPFQKRRLLESLYKNSRSSTNYLADQLQLPRQTVAKLIDQLWQTRVIEAPALLINPRDVNIQSVFLEIRTNPSEPSILKTIASIPGVSSIDGILGEFSLIVKFDFPKLAFASIVEQLDKSIASSQFQSYHIISVLSYYKLGGVILPHSSFERNSELGFKKWNLLQTLQKNYQPARWYNRNNEQIFSKEEQELMVKLNLSRELHFFEQRGIIHGYTIRFNNGSLQKYLKNTVTLPEDSDFGIKFYLRIKPTDLGEYTTLPQNLIRSPQIVDLYRTGEEAGLFAVVRTNSLGQYNTFIKDLYSRYSILNTYTTVVIEEQIATIYPPTLHVAEEMVSLSNQSKNNK